MKNYKKILAGVLVLCMMFVFTACSNRNAGNDKLDNDGDGIIDEVGEDLKDGAEDLKDGVKDIGEDIKDGAEDLVDDFDDDVRNDNNKTDNDTTVR